MKPQTKTISVSVGIRGDTPRLRAFLAVQKDRYLFMHQDLNGFMQKITHNRPLAAAPLYLPYIPSGFPRYH